MRVSLVMTSMGLGGVQQSIVPYALALKRLGCEIQVLVVQGSGVVRMLADNGLEEHATLLEHGWKLFRFLPNASLRGHVASFAPDVVIGFAQMGFFETERALRSLDIPLVTRVGSMQIARLKSFHRADGWLATTPEMQETLASVGYPAERIFLVPNFLAETSAPRALGPLRTPPRVGAMGRFSRRKGFQALIDAIALLRDRGFAVECAIAGDGRTRAELAKQIADRGVSGCVELVGWLDHAHKVRFLESLDLFVSPSLNEPFGFVYLDAMRVGAPIITCPTVGARYIFSAPGTAEIVPLDDPQALAGAIERVLSDDSLRRVLGASAERAFAARFSLDAGARNLEMALAQMTTLKRRSRSA
jgi:glycosyltransferase involved in cell wall biosynthesis